jgi:hypothetical protein
MANVDLLGEKYLMQQLKKLEKLPQKVVTKSVKKGANIVLKEAKKNAPYETGMLEKSLKLVGEKRQREGQKAYQVTFDNNFNTILVKMYGENKEKRAYYPASMEYGFETEKFIFQGLHFLRKSADLESEKAKDVIVDSMANEIDKILIRGK